MADHDLLSLDEAKMALNIDLDNDRFDEELAVFVTAVSERLDDMCGPIVVRDVTGERHDGGCAIIWPNEQPAAELVSVVEYASGVATTLTAETLTIAGDYVLEEAGTLNAHICRRASWSDRAFGAGPVVISYRAGRFDSTDDVSAKFKQAAAKTLGWLWKGDQGAGSATFGGAEATSLYGLGFALPNGVVELLAHERKPPLPA